jgi:hypothetical protein
LRILSVDGRESQTVYLEIRPPVADACAILDVPSDADVPLWLALEASRGLAVPQDAGLDLGQPGAADAPLEVGSRPRGELYLEPGFPSAVLGVMMDAVASVIVAEQADENLEVTPHASAELPVAPQASAVLGVPVNASRVLNLGECDQ